MWYSDGKIFFQNSVSSTFDNSSILCAFDEFVNKQVNLSSIFFDNGCHCAFSKFGFLREKILKIEKLPNNINIFQANFKLISSSHPHTQFL